MLRVVQWLGEGSLLYQLSSHENETVVKTLCSDPESKCTREKVEKGTLCRNGLVEFIAGVSRVVREKIFSGLGLCDIMARK
jgi:hypothetical protein